MSDDEKKHEEVVAHELRNTLGFYGLRVRKARNVHENLGLLPELALARALARFGLVIEQP